MSGITSTNATAKMTTTNANKVGCKAYALEETARKFLCTSRNDPLVLRSADSKSDIIMTHSFGYISVFISELAEMSSWS
jgi:hypothetical protein